MVNTYDVKEELVNLFRSSIDDPLTERASDGKNWVYSDYPRLDSTLPRIGMQEISTTYSSLSIGTAERVKNAAVQVTVMMKEDQKFDVDGDGEIENAEQVLRYLVEQVEDAVIADQDTLRENLDARYVLPQDAVTTRPDGENIIKTDVTIEAEFVN